MKNGTMATVHPFCGVLQEERQNRQQELYSCSECNVHDTVPVHLFLKLLNDLLKKELSNTKKVTYFSDCCAA